MFQDAPGLRADLSRWVFGDKPNMTSMFERSGIVDCGIWAWDVTHATTTDMLKDATRFTGLDRLKLPNWPKEKRDSASQLKNKPKFGAPVRREGAASSTSTSATTTTEASDRYIASVLEDALRKRTLQRREQKNDGTQCVIL